MLIFSIIVTLIAAYFCREEYKNGRIGMAMFWAALLGWDIHSLTSFL